MITQSAKGKTYIATEQGEAISVRGAAGVYYTPNGTPLQVKRAFGDFTVSATAELIPAVEHAAIRILALALISLTDQTPVTLKSDTTAISGVMGKDAIFDRNDDGWFQAAAINQAVNITTGAGSTVAIVALFVEIPEDEFNLL